MGKNPDRHKRVLILDAQAVQTLIIAKKLVQSGYEVDLFCDDKLNYGYHTRYARKRIVSPSLHDDYGKYKSFLLQYIKDNGIDVLLPMTDDSAIFLSKEKKILSKVTNYVMPEYDIFEKAYNKLLLMSLCEEKQYPHPRTINLEIDIHKAESFLFPSLIKPNHMTGGRGMTMVESYQDFLSKYPSIRATYGPCHLQEYIPSGGRQFKVQMFVDEKREVLASSVIYKQRYYPENGGSSCCNVTVRMDALVTLCANILNDIGWVGFADFDLIEDPRDKKIKVMEINPRIPACIKSAIESGPDYATMIADSSLGLPLTKCTLYEPGHKLRHIGFEVLWFIYSKNRFRTKPNWFNFFAKKLTFQDFSWRDPLPFFFGTWGNIKKQLDPDFRKKKAGLR